MAQSSARREERRALATLALMAFVGGVCVQPVVHNLHHRDDHVHGISDVPHAHHPAARRAANPWVAHTDGQERPTPAPQGGSDGSSDPSHGDGSLLHHALALQDNARIPTVVEPVRTVSDGEALRPQVLRDARDVLAEAWPQGPPR